MTESKTYTIDCFVNGKRSDQFVFALMRSFNAPRLIARYRWICPHIPTNGAAALDIEDDGFITVCGL